MKQIPLIVLGLALVILVSGCTGSQKVTVAPNDGIKIIEFSTDADMFSNEEPIPLYLQIENQGSTTATNVVMEIIGASWDQAKTETIAKMSPPDLTMKPAVPGDFEIYNPSLQPYSRLPEGVEAQVDLRAKVTYNYDSNGQVSIPIVNKDEYRRRLKMNKEVPATKSVQNSNGPIHLDIDERGLSPIVAGTDQGTTEDVAMTITINNVGSGAPITGDQIGAMAVNLDLMGSGATFLECLGNTAYAGTTISNMPITLRRGEHYTIPCKVRVSTPLTEDTVSVLFRTSYKYFVEQPLTITVVGAPQS
jgi:hypothetical protein